MKMKKTAYVLALLLLAFIFSSFAYQNVKAEEETQVDLSAPDNTVVPAVTATAPAETEVTTNIPSESTPSAVATETKPAETSEPTTPTTTEEPSAPAETESGVPNASESTGSSSETGATSEAEAPAPTEPSESTPAAGDTTPNETNPTPAQPGANELVVDVPASTELEVPTTPSLILDKFVLAVTPTQDVKLTWQHINGVDGYIIMKQYGNGGMVEVGRLAGVEFIDKQALPGLNFYRIVPYIAEEQGGSVGYKWAKVNPKAVTNVKTKSEYDPEKFIQVNWDPSPGVNKYHVYRKNPQDTAMALFKTVTSGAEVKDTSGVMGYVQYYVVPVFDYVNSAGKTEQLRGLPSKIVTDAIAPDVLTKEKLRASSDTKGNSSLTWSAVPGASEYLIFRQTGAESKMTYVTSVKDTKYLDTKALSGATFYRVMPAVRTLDYAKDPVVLKPKYRHPGGDYVYTMTRPKPVTGLTTASEGRWGTKLSWQAVPGVDAYGVYRKNKSTGKLELVDTTKTLSYSEDFLFPGTHNYSVMAVREYNEKIRLRSEASALAAATVKEVTNSKDKPEVFLSDADFKHFQRIMIARHTENVYAVLQQDVADKEDMPDQHILFRGAYRKWLANLRLDKALCAIPTMAEMASASYESNWQAATERAMNIAVLSKYTYHTDFAKYKLADDVITKVAATAKTKGNDYQRLKFVYELAIKGTAPALNADGTVSHVNPSGVSSHSSYSVVKDARAVSQGYTSFLLSAYKKMGYNVFYAISPSDKSTWLMVQVSGKWYHVDAYLGDKQAAGVDYKYFLTSDDEISKYHPLEGHLPKANVVYGSTP